MGTKRSLSRLGSGAAPAAAGEVLRQGDQVKDPPVAVAYAASLTPVASDGNYRVCTATGDLTLNPPTAPADGQMWRLRVIASGGARTVTLAAGFRRPAHIAATLPIASGRRGDIGLLYETADGAWTVLAAQTA